MVKTISIFAASSDKVNNKYKKAAHETGRILSEQKITGVYGGGAIGLMGSFAKGILEGKGTLIGVIPQFMVDMHWDYDAVTEMIVVNTMFERKQKIIEMSDAIIALPGGIGTLDELLDAITLKQLGQYTHPIIILNTDGYYNSILEQLNKMIDEQFMREVHRNIYHVVNYPSEILLAINNAPKWDNGAIQQAAIE